MGATLTKPASRRLSVELQWRVTPRMMRDLVDTGRIPEPNRLPGSGHYLWTEADIERARLALLEMRGRQTEARPA